MVALTRRNPVPLVLLALLLGTRPAPASPLQFVPVDDPIVAELRVLDLYAPAAGRSPLPALDAGPWRAGALGPSLDFAAAAPGPRGLAMRRVTRALDRDVRDDGASGRSTPRLAWGAWPDGSRAELSMGLEGENDLTRTGGHTSGQWVNGSGVHARLGVQVQHWLAYAHLSFGELHGVRAFSDALVANTDIAATTEESYLAYADRGWDAQLGRGRWAWGPGEEGSLMLSRTMAPVNGLMLHLRVSPLHADAFVFDATVNPGTGEQLAAHRIEWQPRANVRLGLSESARYHAGGWQGVYLAGVIPYAVAQRLLDQDSPGHLDTLRNNVMIGGDLSVRVADGSRVYAELLIDDLHARTAEVPNKYAGQAGWSGTGTVGGSRLTWNAEYTWLSRYVYTSFFGRSYVAQGLPLGFPTGPDARRFRTRVTWDPCEDWQLGVAAARTEHGFEGIADPFVPGGPVPDVNSLADPVERTRTAEGLLRWWPASGVDVSLRAGRVWVENAGNARGAVSNPWTAALAFRLTR